MVNPFRRNDKDDVKIMKDVDEDIDAVLDFDSQENPIAKADQPEPTTSEERLHAISDMVIQTCMDIRRGENVEIRVGGAG